MIILGGNTISNRKILLLIFTFLLCVVLSVHYFSVMNIEKENQTIKVEETPVVISSQIEKEIEESISITKESPVNSKEYVVNVKPSHSPASTQNATKNTVTQKETATPTKIVNAKYSKDDLFCMAAVIYNEAGGNACSDTHRILVGNVVLNRVRDSRFPNTIRKVVQQKGQYSMMSRGVKFATRSKYSGEKAAVARAYKIAKMVLEGKQIAPKKVVFQSQSKQGKGVWKKVGNTYFCY